MLEWLAMGAIGLLSEKRKRDQMQSRYNKHAEIWLSLRIDPDLEEQLWHDVADPLKYDEVWNRIEKYKIDHPDICETDPTNWWGHVGEWRFPTYFKPGERFTKKKDEQLTTFCKMTVDLLAMTYGKHSNSQAGKIADIAVFGRMLS